MSVCTVQHICHCLDYCGVVQQRKSLYQSNNGVVGWRQQPTKQTVPANCLERVTLVNNNQIQGWLTCPFNLSVSVSVRWFYNNLSHVTYHVCTIDSTGHLNLPIVFSPWCKGLWAFSCCSSTAVIWVKQHLFIASCEAYWWRKCFRIPFPFTICKIT